MDDFKKILIIKPSALGDVVMSLPALNALKSRFPDSRISWMIRPEFSSIISDHPQVDDVIEFDRKKLGKVLSSGESRRALIGLLKKLRSSKFDAVIDLQGLFRTASLGWLSGCKNRFGMKNAREGATIFYTQKAKQKEGSVHVIDHYMEAVRMVTGEESEVRFDYPVSRGSRQEAEAILDEARVNKNNFAVFIPGASLDLKCWPSEKFAELADRVAEEFGLDIAAVGTAGEAKIIDEINRISKAEVVNLAGKTSISQLSAVLDASKIVVSNDTGPGHIAAALNKPLVMVFGHTNPRRLGPYGKPECVAAIEYDKRGDEIKLNNPDYYIYNVPVELVLDRFRAQLGK